MSRQLTRRQFLIASLAATSGSVLAACAAPQTATTPSAPQPTAGAVAASPTPAQAAVPQTLVLGWIGYGDTNWNTEWSAVQHWANAGVRQWVFQALAAWNHEINGYVGQIAESWEANADSSVWTVKLRPGLQWSDGVPLTARDIYYQNKLLMTKAYSQNYVDSGLYKAEQIIGGKEYYEGQATEVDGLKVVDDTTLEYHLTKPMGTTIFVEDILMRTVVEVPEHHFSQWTPEQLTDHAIWEQPRPVCGPFLFTKYVKDQYLEMLPNPLFWRGKPKLEKLTYRYFQTEEASLLAMQAGEVDFSVTADPATANQWKTTPGFTQKVSPTWGGFYINFNFRDPTFQDIRIRQAIWHAIDRDAIIEGIYLGGAEKMNSLMSASYNLGDQLIDYEYDPAKARALLEEAGWNQTEPLDMATNATGALNERWIVAVQQYLAEVGIEVTPRFLDLPASLALMRSGDWKIMFWSGWNVPDHWAKGNNPAVTLAECPATDLGCYPEIDRVTELINTAWMTNDDQTRKDAYREVNEILNREAIAVFLHGTVLYAIYKDTVQNLVWWRPRLGVSYDDLVDQWYISA